MIGILAMVAYAVFVAAIYPLPLSRYLVALACAVVMMFCTNQAHASSATFCDGWSSLAQKALDVRQQGLEQEDAKALMVEAGVWSVPMEYALRHAYQVPMKTDLTTFKARMFKACRDDDL